MSQHYSTSYVNYTLHDDGILEAVYNHGVKVDKDVAHTVIEERLALQAGKAFFLLIRAEGDVEIDREARIYFAGPEGTRGIHAAAFLAHNGITTMIGNFIIMVHRPQAPARLFTDRKRAINWLHRCRLQMKENNTPQKTPPDFDTHHIQFILGHNDHILAVNETACKRLGYTRDWLVGLHFSMISEGNVLYDNKRSPIRVTIQRTQLPHSGRWYSDTFIQASEVVRQPMMTAASFQLSIH